MLMQFMPELRKLFSLAPHFKKFQNSAAHLGKNIKNLFNSNIKYPLLRLF